MGYPTLVWATIGLGALLCLVSVVLFYPLNLSLSIDTASSRKFNLKLVWLFGSIRLKRGKPSRKLHKTDGSLAFRILRLKGMRNAVFRFVRALLRCLEVRDLEGELTIGLDDPADTGMLMGALIPTGIALSQFTGRRFSFRPSFEGAVFEGRGLITVRVIPVRVLLATGRFLFSLPAFGAVKWMVTSRWKKKR